MAEKSMDANNSYQCTSLVVSALPIRQGNLKFYSSLEIIKFVLFSEDTRIILRFKSVAHLLRFKDDKMIMNMLSSFSCLMTIADVSTDTEVLELVDTVTKFRVAKKHLIISIHKLDVASLQNKTINFNVVIYHKGGGSTMKRNILNLKLCNILLLSFRWGGCDHMFMSCFGRDSCAHLQWTLPRPLSVTIWEGAESFLYWNCAIYKLSPNWRK